LTRQFACLLGLVTDAFETKNNKSQGDALSSFGGLMQVSSTGNTLEHVVLIIG
jgi:hypothetical protein